MTAVYSRSERVRLGSGSVAERLHKLEALRQLTEGMSDLEREHQQRLERGDQPAEVDRDIAKRALTGVAAYCQELGIESGPLVRLLGALEALSAGSRPPAMFAPTVSRHRRPDSPTTEGIKGRLAAIMEYRQDALTRKAAAAWVARNIPPKMKDRLGSIKPATVGSWLVKWGGIYGTTSECGREGYLAMRAILTDLRPSESDLKKILEVLSQSLLS